MLWWEVKPFCFEQGALLTGFGCEMIEAVLAEAGLPYEMIEVESSAAALERLGSGGGDVTSPSWIGFGIAGSIRFSTMRRRSCIGR